MTREEKQLLLKDICARLPYGVKATFGEKYGFLIDGITIESDEIYVWLEGCNYPLGQVKPYLRPMSSMTKKEKEICSSFAVAYGYSRTIMIPSPIAMDYLLSRHFDVRGLIPRGLALEASDNMYKTE